MRNTDRMKFVIGLVLLFGGLNLAILLSHLSRYYGVALIFAGIGVLAWAARDIEKTIPETEKPDNLASKIVHAITFNGKFIAFLPLMGIGVLVTVIAFNLMVANNYYLGSNDYVALLLGGVLIAYNFIPKRYAVERDFALLFSLLLFILLVIPTTILELTSSDADTNSPITYYLLAAPTAALSRLFGIPVVSPFMDAGTPIYNHMEIIGNDGMPIILSISLSCSGLYSVAIFVSAFIAFVAVEYKKFDRKVGLLLGIGIFLAWVANILRMTLIIVVGYYEGAATMVWVHNNVGELIFMAWVTLFWLFMFRYFGILDKKTEKTESGRSRRGKCAVCGEPLSPTIPSARCECGSVFHSGCILTEGSRCPSCGVDVNIRNREDY
ncbi:MAG: archaeosortase/exosortase family protein [Candidatus Thermoplasmatota archaeon]|nr:hypothetical protein [Euryarchaeota archaeon]MBU4031805.1 archaeosortase/exosortase family protein [Candidatus Thermoplasmatota archaeon]MBU4071833.1 archaeosortase/exosortase family protein [Candidatus Thermoplasmatota archaeon]MBU4145326.1 archaeosortase/exosortase family protein [Candidatus Thermoplasmatota archaeon]MBU4592220.1 archaeosortase/exosortase family protein [Candidatus Thermoplasmatota archaeon]